MAVLEKNRSEFASAYSLFELLVTENNSYFVPKYQREYAWTEMQVEDLWSDFFTFWEERSSGEDYLLGQVIVSPKSSQKKEFFVVDGQQRFTTIFLLLSAARDFAKARFNESHSKDVKGLEEFCDATLFSMTSGSRQPRLMVTEGGQKAFLNLIGGEGHHPNSTDLSAQNIRDNYNFFLTKFGDNFASKATKFFSFLEMIRNNVILIYIKLPNDEQALEFFERTNDRGLPLNQSDLMKNLLFSKVKPTEYESISKLWATSVARLRGIETTRLKSMDFTLKALLSEVSGESYPRKKVFREWRERLSKDLDAEEFLNLIDEVTIHIAEISQQQDGSPVSERTTGSRYLNAIQQWTVTSAARNHTEDLQIAVADVVEARTILSTVVRERSQDFERVISPWAKAISKIKSDAKGSARDLVLSASKKALVDVPGFLKNDLGPNLSALTYERPADRKRIKLILAIANREMALMMNHDSSEFSLSTFVMTKTYDLEHIEPRSRAGSNKYTDDNRQLIDSIGNLTLWFKSDNRSKGDVDPAKKATRYAESSVLITQALCPAELLAGDGEDSKWSKVQLPEGNILENWGEESIAQREALISKLLARYFERTLGL